MAVTRFVVMLVVAIMRVSLGADRRLMVCVMTLHDPMLAANNAHFGGHTPPEAQRRLVRPDQHLHMFAYAAGECAERIAAFERGDDATA